MKKYYSMDEIEKAWFACAIDGEGTIAIRRSKNRASPVRLMIYNTCIAFLKRAQQIVPDGRIYMMPKRQAMWKQEGQFTLNAHKKVINVLQQILPYLIVKKELAEEAIKIIQNYDWRFTRDQLSPEVSDFIINEAETKGIREISRTVKEKYRLTLDANTVLRIIKSRGKFIRHCLICKEPFEVSHKFRKYCSQHTMASYDCYYFC